MYVREVRMRYGLRKVNVIDSIGCVLNRPADAAQIFGSILSSELIEVCGLLCLSTRHHLLAYHELSRGTIDGTVVHPRDVFRVALAVNARAVIVGHNHPSGDPTPTADDLAITKRLMEAGALIGIDLCDHIVVGQERRYASMKELGML